VFGRQKKSDAPAAAAAEEPTVKNQTHRFATTSPALLTSKLKTLLSLKRWKNVLSVADAHLWEANKRR